MRNPLYLIGLSVVLFSCATKKPVQNIVKNPKPTNSTINQPQKTVKIPQQDLKHEGQYDFYKVNIADKKNKHRHFFLMNKKK